jgi:hypothetical protein
MAGWKKHMTVAASVAGGVNFLWQLLKVYKGGEPPRSFWAALARIDYLEVAAFSAGGAVLGALPDILEPATNPNHRALFHSLSCAGAVIYGAFGKHSDEWRPDDRFGARAIALSYLSHLYLDAGTRKGLPLIC